MEELDKQERLDIDDGPDQLKQLPSLDEVREMIRALRRELSECCAQALTSSCPMDAHLWLARAHQQLEIATARYELVFIDKAARKEFLPVIVGMKADVQQATKLSLFPRHYNDSCF